MNEDYLYELWCVVFILLVGSVLSIVFSAVDDQTINLFPLVVIGCGVYIVGILWKIKKGDNSV